MINKIKKEKFDIEILIKYAEEFHPRFYRDFVSKIDDNIWLETSIRLAINLDDDDYKYLDYDGKMCYDYYQVVKNVGFFYGIYNCESDFYKDFFNKYFLN